MAETSESSAAASSAAEEAASIVGREENSDHERTASFSPELVAAEVSYPPDGAIGTAGYARLAGTGKGAIDYLIRSKTVTIGRAGFGADCQLRSDTKSVSRHHATIQWDIDAQVWVITCHSPSNALMVDGAPVLVGTPPMPLRSRVLIEVGDAAFFFLAAVEPYYRTDNVGMLEQQVEDLRDSRLRERELLDIRQVNYKGGVATGGSRGKRPRRRGGSEDEYGEEDMAVVKERNGHQFDGDGQNGALTADEDGTDDDQPILDYDQRRRSKKRKRSGFDGGHGEEDNREARKRRKKEKKKKKKKKQRRREEQAAAAAAAAAEAASRRRAAGDGETEDEQEDSDDRMQVDENATDASEESREPIAVNDGFDSAPVPSLRGAKAARALQSKKKSAKPDPGVRAEWNKKERADFCRSIFAVDVDKVYDGNGNLVTYDWTRFRGIARLEKKSDEMLEEFYMRMMADMDSLLEEEEREKRTKGPRTKHKPGCDCVVCENTRKSRRKKEEENREDDGDEGGDAGSGDQRDIDGEGEGEDEGGRSGGRDQGPADKASSVERILGLVTAQKLRVRMGIHEAARQVDSPAGQSVIRKFRTQPRVAAANGDLPAWWVNGDHDHALMIGTARHGVGQWKEIWMDRHNRELVDVRKEYGDDIEWPTTQVAMKRLREVSSAINAEIRRMEKKKARKSGDDGGGSAPSRPSKSRGDGGTSHGRRASAGGGKSSARRKSKREATPESEDDMGENAEEANDGDGVDSGEESAEEIEIEIEEEGDEEEDEEGGEVENEGSGTDCADEEEEMVEVEIEEDDSGAEVASGTASDSDDS